MKKGQVMTPAFMLTISIIVIGLIIVILLVMPVTRNQLIEPSEMKDNQTRESGSCVFTDSYWTKGGQQVTQADEGDLLELTVESQNCQNQIVQFETWTDASLIGTSEKIIITGGITSASWRAPTTGSAYGVRFIAKLQGSSLSIESPNLVVNPIIEDINKTEMNETNTTEPTSFECPYGNDEKSYATCDITYMLQSEFTFQTLDHTGINSVRKATSVSGGWLLASGGMEVSDFLAVSKSSIINRFNSTFQEGGRYEHIDPKTTTELFIIDIEKPVRMQELFHYYNQSPGYTDYTFKEIVDALNLRLEVAREILPNAKISLYGTIIPNGITTRTSTDWIDQQLIGLIEAGELGLYDDIDYISPQLYTHTCLPDEPTSAQIRRYEEIPEQAEISIETAMKINNSKGEPMDMAVIISNRVFGLWSGAPESCRWAIQNPEMIRKQVDSIQKYERVKSINLWSAHEEEVVAWFEEAKLVPSECFCDQEFKLPPRAKLIVEPKIGPDPLEVKLTLKDILDPEGESISFEWYFEGYHDRGIDRTGKGPYTYEYIVKPGDKPKEKENYNIVVWLKGSGGRKSVAHDWIEVINGSA